MQRHALQTHALFGSLRGSHSPAVSANAVEQQDEMYLLGPHGSAELLGTVS